MTDDTTPHSIGFRLNCGTQLQFGGQADRYKKNLKALSLLRQLQAEERDPLSLTDAERLDLAHYSAFGDSALLKRAFTGDDLEALVSEEEADHIRRTSLTAFYTSSSILLPLWDAIAPALRTGCGPLAILEPAFGIGMVAATMPDDIRARATIDAVELDHVSSQIASFLHPDVRIASGIKFEETDLPANHYDLALSNVPFGDMKVFDPRMPERHLCRVIHDYFVSRMLMLVRPGGIVAVISSYGTLDKKDSRTRAWLAERARLVSAIRLPQGVFSENAGTACGADILILQKYQDDEVHDPTPWISTDLVTYPLTETTGGHFTQGSQKSDYEATGEAPSDDAAQLRINTYFIDRPEKILGTVSMVRKNGLLWQMITPPTDATVRDMLAHQIRSLPIIVPERVPSETTEELATIVHHETPRARALLTVYAAAKAVLAADMQSEDATELRLALNLTYDTFVQDYGAIHTRANQIALKGRPELLLLKALETDVRTRRDGTTIASKVALFTCSTVRAPKHRVPGSMLINEALIWCLNECGKVNLDAIAELSGETVGDVTAALRGTIFHDPAINTWVMADEYLSGNVRLKLAVAQERTKIDPHYQSHCDALQTVLPVTLTPAKIKVNFGAPWVPSEDIAAFITELIPDFATHGGSIRYLPKLAQWVVTTEQKIDGVEAINTWGTTRAHPLRILEDALNTVQTKVYDTTEDGQRILNKQETLAAQAKQQLIKERWLNWVWLDPLRTERLCTTYNHQFNNLRRRDYDGSHLHFAGINTAILRTGDLDTHQRDAVWMALCVRSQLVHLTVGGGKTFIALATAYEWKRLGLARKPMITVPAHLIEQWTDEANRLYPTMRVLAITPAEFTVQRRGVFLNRIATEDWDLILCTHTSFERIEITAAGDFIQGQINELDWAITDIKADSDPKDRSKQRSIKEYEKRKDALETKLAEMDYQLKRDSGVLTFEMLGVDALIVDEAHEFKNLMVQTSKGDIKGVPTGNAARAFDMRMKTWYMLKQQQRVVFLTATPILNSIGEVYVMQKFLQDDLLETYGLAHFDAWVATFGEVVPVFEMTPDGAGFRLTNRLARFVNLPELFQPWYQMTFARSRKQLGLPTPKLVTGKPIAVAVPGSRRLQWLTQWAARRAEAIKTGKIDPREDNMLKITSDGKKAALDVRYFFKHPDPINKIEMVCDHMAAIYHKFDAAKATQLLFCELGTPSRKKGSASKQWLVESDDQAATDEPETLHGFIYNDIRAGLVKRGIPVEEVAFIQEHTSKTKRTKLFADMNSGKKRILLLSKQTTGLNVQKRLLAVHNLDAPWRPGDLVQRIGRAERQGNLWSHIYVFNYATTNSFDGFVWQTIETKARFIEQFESGDITIREIDDISGVAASAAEVKAIASNNPHIRRKVELDAELTRLESLRRSFYQAKDMYRSQKLDNHYKQAMRRETITQYTSLLGLLAATEDTPFTATVLNNGAEGTETVYTKRKDAGEALIAASNQLLEQAVVEEKEKRKAIFGKKASAHNAFDSAVRKTAVIGMYRGIAIESSAYASPSNQYEDMYLVFSVSGKQHKFSNWFISQKTPEGVFASIDARLRKVPHEIADLEADLRKLDQSTTELDRQIERSWDLTERFVTVTDAVAAINRQLNQSKQEEAATGNDPEEDTQEEGKPNTFDYDTQPEPMPAPAIVIPEPEESELFAQAFAQIIELTKAEAQRHNAQPQHRTEAPQQTDKHQANTHNRKPAQPVAHISSDGAPVFGTIFTHLKRSRTRTSKASSGTEAIRQESMF